MKAESARVVDGVWLIGGTTHNSVAGEFADVVAVVEAPLNEQRSLAVKAEVSRLIPNKPVRCVVNTHHHTQYAGGLRTYVAEGATVVTHLGNVEYFDRVMLNPAPRTLAPMCCRPFIRGRFPNISLRSTTRFCAHPHRKRSKLVGFVQMIEE